MSNYHLVAKRCKVCGMFFKRDGTHICIPVRKRKEINKEFRLNNPKKARVSSMLGKHHTQKTKLKLSQKLMGRAKSPKAHSWKKGGDNPFWKGGKTKQEGYNYVVNDIPLLRKYNGYAKKCEVVWYENTGEVIEHPYLLHHIDGDKTNDDFKNLQKVTRSEHAKIHNEERLRIKGQFTKRPADLDLETARCWIPTKEEEIEWKENGKEALNIDLGNGQSIGLWGFSKMEKQGKLIIAYKIKAESQQVLYHIPDNLDTQDKQIVESSLEDLKKIIPFEFQDVKEVAKNLINSEGNTIDRLSKMKKKGQKNEVEK